MGCDIHIAIERRNGNGWVRVPFISTPYGERKDDGYFWQEFDKAVSAGALVMPRCFDNRCYNLFGIIGDVRNGSGFAGIRTGEAWPPIAPDRGFPDDANPIEPYVLGDHSFTWVGLDELQAFDWDGTVRRERGCLTFAQWQKWQASGQSRPDEWCGFVSGGKTRIIPQALALEWSGPVDDNLYVEAEWSVTAREAVDDWPGQVLPVLERIASGADLRLLIGFDS